jgi:hypothetical protein
MTRSLLLGLGLLLATLPSTSNYELNSYGFGSGGTANSTTTTYALEGSSGELTGQPADNSGAGGSSYSRPGYVQTQQANLPLISLDNESGNDYNRLHFVIDPQGNPADALYLIAVSTTSGFTTTDYVQSDGTLSGTLNISNDYQTYAAWGSAGGSHIIGLSQSTTYYAKVLATQGKFTETTFGPVSNATTVTPTLTFSLQTSSGPTPPYAVNFGTLAPGIPTPSAQTINTALSTDGASGGDVYITGQNGGLFSTSRAHKINSVTGNLGSLSDGFGAQNASITQTSGGPYSVVSPYNVSGNNVGIIDATTRSLYTSANPVSGGSAVLTLLAEASMTDSAASDYQEVLTFTAAANF